MRRAAPEDWLRAGLTLLRDRGESALTIEALCRAMGRTKGSFYHHFPELDAYQEQLLGFWEAHSTAGPIAQADAAASGAQRRRTLYTAVSHLELHVERAIQAWALREPRARAARARVDARRLAYLARIWEEEGLSPARAAVVAELEYASFLGALSLYDLDTDAGKRQAARLAKQLLASLRRDLPGAKS